MKNISHKSFACFEPSHHMTSLTWLEYLTSSFPGICFYHLFYYFSIACHYEAGTFIFLKCKCPIFYFVYLDGTIFHWSANVQRSPNFTYSDVFSFSSENSRRTLEPLSRHWHKNWQPTGSQLGPALCSKIKNTQNSEVSSNLLISLEHYASLQATS